jgi:hypothetical protein
VKNLPGRPKTDKLDAVWLAKLTEKGLLRPSFVPPAGIRQLRDYTRLRVDLTRERTRHWQRLEKLLEDALIKVSSVASKLDTRSVRDMLEALIAGDRDPRRLAELARGRMKTKRAALVEALNGRFDEHHAEIARMLLDQIDGLSAAIDQLTTRAEFLLQTLLAARVGDQQAGGAVPAPGSGDPCQAPTEAPTEASVPANGPLAHRGGNGLSASQRLDEIAGIGPLAAQVIIAELGSRGALLRPGPLRTAQAAFTASSSSKPRGRLRFEALRSCVGECEARSGKKRERGGFDHRPVSRVSRDGRGSPP